jgi:hypothetical protein
MRDICTFFEAHAISENSPQRDPREFHSGLFSNPDAR